MSKFLELAEQTGLPPEALKPIIDSFQSAEKLILENNKRIAQVNAARAQNDPKDHSYIDSLWRTHAPLDEEMSTIEAEYQALIEESEKKLAQLRAFGKTKIEEPLSEEKAAETRKLVNESAPTITTAKAQAAALVTVIDSMLSIHGKAIDGGVISLLPQVESLKNARGRKAGTPIPGGGYMTRVDEILIDGKSTNQMINGESKGKFNFAADKLSQAWGAEKFPENRVTAEELETAFLNKHGYENREASKGDPNGKEAKLPEGESEFTFSKEVTVPSGNDDSTKKIPQTVKITVKRPVKAEPVKAETSNPEPANTEKAEAKVETPKVENVTPAKQEVPAKKTAAPAKK